LKGGTVSHNVFLLNLDHSMRAGLSPETFAREAYSIDPELCPDCRMQCKAGGFGRPSSICKIYLTG
jgi:hypothetical protein